MTYKELYEKAIWLLEHNEINGKEYDKMIEPLNAEVGNAEPVRHGKWKWLSCTYDRVPKEKEYECSKCHHKTIVHGDDMPWEKYCPNCGAKMDVERKEE